MLLSCSNINKTFIDQLEPENGKIHRTASRILELTAKEFIDYPDDYDYYVEKKITRTDYPISLLI